MVTAGAPGGCPPRSTPGLPRSQCGDPDGACLLMGVKAGGLLHTGHRPCCHVGRRGKGCQPRRKRSRCLRSHDRRSTTRALELKALRQSSWRGSTRARGHPLCLCVFPGPTKAAAVSLTRHCRLHPLGLWQRQLAKGQWVQSQQTPHFMLEVEGCRLSARPARGSVTPWRRDEADIGEMLPEGTGHGGMTGSLPPPLGVLTGRCEGSDQGRRCSEPQSHCLGLQVCCWAARGPSQYPPLI